MKRLIRAKHRNITILLAALALRLLLAAWARGAGPLGPQVIVDALGAERLWLAVLGELCCDFTRGDLVDGDGGVVALLLGGERGLLVLVAEVLRARGVYGRGRRGEDGQVLVEAAGSGGLCDFAWDGAEERALLGGVCGARGAPLGVVGAVDDGVELLEVGVVVCPVGAVEVVVPWVPEAVGGDGAVAFRVREGGGQGLLEVQGGEGEAEEGGGLGMHYDVWLGHVSGRWWKWMMDAERENAMIQAREWIMPNCSMARVGPGTYIDGRATALTGCCRS